MTFGKVLAVLKFMKEQGVECHSVLSDDSDIERVMTYHNLYTHLLQKRIAMEIPVSRCKVSQPFLQNADDFFITHLVLEPNGHREYYSSLIKHLNDCYACFEIYSQVFKDYYHALQWLNHKES